MKNIVLIEETVRQYLQSHSVAILVDLIQKKCDPKSQTETDLLTVFESIQLHLIYFYRTHHTEIVVTFELKKGIDRYSDRIIVVLKNSANYGVFDCSVADYTFRKSALILQLQ